jgi:hypothetical protein
MNPEEAEWNWQGFLGKMADAIAGKLEVDDSPLGGAWLPQRGDPPMPVDKNGEWGMFGVMVRKGAEITAPPNMLEADAALVGRMVGG